jgi:hypothetical protein
MRRSLVAAVVLVVSFPGLVLASRHGPVFGVATPTLGKGGWQLDQAWFGRLGEGSQTEEQTLRTMISFGITEDLQISGSVTITLVTSSFMPRGRMMAMMSTKNELEAHRIVALPSSSVRCRIAVRIDHIRRSRSPLERYRSDGMQAAASAHVAAATGYVSRTHYVWVGGGYHHHDQRGLDRMGNVVFLSGVYGYRPPALRLDYPKPDLRFFVEAMGERTARGQHHGFELVTSGGTAVFVGPTALLLYKAYAVEGGMLFPVYQDTNFGPEERFRSASTSATFSGENRYAYGESETCCGVVGACAVVARSSARGASTCRSEDIWDGLNGLCPRRARGRQEARGSGIRGSVARAGVSGHSAAACESCDDGAATANHQEQRLQCEGCDRHRRRHARGTCRKARTECDGNRRRLAAHVSWS